MAIQTVFKRCEMKYMITTAQREFIVAEMEPYMTPDLYGKTTVRNIYYDTDTYLLVRRSIEKPVYKKKNCAYAAMNRQIQTVSYSWS